MESENFEDLANIFNQINIENNPQNTNNVYTQYQFKPAPKLRRIFPDPIDFEKYIQENCENKYKVLDRLTFYEIKRPIIIIFNHFREKCAYHTKWLDIIYQLAIKYGDQIEFIAGDMIDINVINPKWNPITYFSLWERPEDVFPNIFAIDIKKRIHKHDYEYESAGSDYSELCEKLLNGELFPSQLIPDENNDTNLVKICVSDNFEDLILKSPNDILLICSSKQYLEYEPDYEKLAIEIKDKNLNIVYMEAMANYIPFEYEAYCYPTILFIPHNDKNNFLFFKESITEENILAFVKELIAQPKNLKLKQEEQQIQRYQKHKSVVVAEDFEIDFQDLPQYLAVNFQNSIKVLDRKSVDKINKWILIIYMDFQDKCLAHHIQWLDKIYQVVGPYSHTFSYLIADYKDIDLINTKWKPSDFRTTENPIKETPKIFAIDSLKHTFEGPDFKTQTALYYFICGLFHGDFYYSQCYPRYQELLTTTCVADSFYNLLKQSKKDLFITFYDPDHKESEKLLNILEEIAQDIKDTKLCVEVVNFNSRENYVNLEYAHHSYPVQYFISRHNKKENVRYIYEDLNKDNFLEFILSCTKSKF